MVLVWSNNLGLSFTAMDYTIKIIDMNDRVEITNIDCNPSIKGLIKWRPGKSGSGKTAW